MNLIVLIDLIIHLVRIISFMLCHEAFVIIVSKLIELRMIDALRIGFILGIAILILGFGHSLFVRFMSAILINDLFILTTFSSHILIIALVPFFAAFDYQAFISQSHNLTSSGEEVLKAFNFMKVVVSFALEYFQLCLLTN